MNTTSANWLDDSRELDRLIAEARRMRAEAMAHYLRLAFSTVKEGVVALLAPFRQWQERSALDAELRGMTDMELRDIGLSRSDIASVVNGSYRDERGQTARRRPILVRLDPGQRRLPPHRPAGKPKAA
jgi:uncharacterized protein YjiS (DUF1127 family)